MWVFILLPSGNGEPVAGMRGSVCQIAHHGIRKASGGHHPPTATGKGTLVTLAEPEAAGRSRGCGLGARDLSPPHPAESDPHTRCPGGPLPGNMRLAALEPARWHHYVTPLHIFNYPA